MIDVEHRNLGATARPPYPEVQTGRRWQSRRLKPRWPQRRAFTLVEILASLAIISTIFSAILLSLHALQKVSNHMTDAVALAAQQQQFIAQLRRDGHLTRSAKVSSAEQQDAGNNLARLELADGRRVEYEISGMSVERRVLTDKGIAHRESYRVLPSGEQGWQLDNTSHHPRLSIWLSPAADRAEKHTVVTPFQATVTVLMSSTTTTEAKGAVQP